MVDLAQNGSNSRLRSEHTSVLIWEIATRAALKLSADASTVGNCSGDEGKSSSDPRRALILEVMETS